MQLCLCKRVAEKSMRLERRQEVLSPPMHLLMFSDVQSLLLGNCESAGIAKVVQIAWGSQRAREPRNPPSQSGPLGNLPTSSWPLPTLLSRSKEKHRSSFKWHSYKAYSSDRPYCSGVPVNALSVTHLTTEVVKSWDPVFSRHMLFPKATEFVCFLLILARGCVFH